MAGRLTTHVLDVAAGRPAAGLVIELWRLDKTPQKVRTVTTNADGRVDGALLEGPGLTAGTYELRFHAGDYLKSRSSGTAFLDVVPVRFAVSAPDEHYHVPLLLAPYGYSTYRGS